MSEDRAAPNSGEVRKPYQKVLDDSYYGLLGVHPSASMRDIRQAYWDLSKLYHPDTTKLPTAIATAKFQQLNEAYATLSNPERRGVYDRKIGYSSVPVIQPLPNLNTTTKQPRKYQSSSAYLDPTDRPLSPGELFALFIMGVTLIGCLCLAIMIGLTRGEALLQTKMVENDTMPSLVQPAPTTARPTAPSAKTTLSSEPFSEPEPTVASPKPFEQEDKTLTSPASSSVQSRELENAAVSAMQTRLDSPASSASSQPPEAISPVSSPSQPLPDIPQKAQS